MSVDLDFEFYVGGIEDSILGLLTTEMQPLGVKSFETYSGQLDNENLKKAISAKAMSFPLVMVSYADGVTHKDPATAPVMGEPVHYRHDCTFIVIVASNDARGSKAARRGALTAGNKIGAYSMISKVWDTLAGRRLFVTIDDAKLLLTTEVLTPAAIDFMAKLPNITAYAVVIETAFRWSSPDRSEAGVDVTEMIVGVNKDATSVLPGEQPGVKK